MIDKLIERLEKCPEYTCNRCQYNGTEHCAVTEAIRELRRFDMVIDVLKLDALKNERGE